MDLRTARALRGILSVSAEERRLHKLYKETAPHRLDETDLARINWHAAAIGLAATVDAHHETLEAALSAIAGAPNYRAAAVAMLARHDREARLSGFKKCRCRDCSPFRAAIAKAEGRS